MALSVEVGLGVLRELLEEEVEELVGDRQPFRPGNRSRNRGRQVSRGSLQRLSRCSWKFEVMAVSPSRPLVVGA